VSPVSAALLFALEAFRSGQRLSGTGHLLTGSRGCSGRDEPGIIRVFIRGRPSTRIPDERELIPTVYLEAESEKIFSIV
jgi:hypothetical protein